MTLERSTDLVLGRAAVGSARRAGTSSARADGAQLTRRAACALGAGVSAATLLGPAAAVAAAGGLPAQRQPIRYVLTDKRYAESLAFGAALARDGGERLEVTAGLTRLWLDALVPLWRGQTGAVAGLTEPGTWICIAEQARSCRRRSVLMGRHGPSLAADAVEHRLSAPAPVLARAGLLADCGDLWPSVMARLAGARPAELRPAADEGFRCIDATAPAPSAHLVSWIIA